MRLPLILGTLFILSTTSAYSDVSKEDAASKVLTNFAAMFLDEAFRYQSEKIQLCSPSKNYTVCQPELLNRRTSDSCGHKPGCKLSVLSFNVDMMLEMRLKTERLSDLVSGRTMNAAGDSSLVPQADIIILNELERNCKRSSGRDFAAEIAEDLDFNYLYFPEFTNLKQSQGGAHCTTGSAILSRFPLSNPSFHFFKTQCCFFGHRLGGRSFLGVDVEVREGQKVKLVAVHLESGTSLSDEIQAENTRIEQVKEMLSKLGTSNDFPIIIGGDFNAPFGASGPVVKPIFDAGYADAHSSLPTEERVTSPTPSGSSRPPLTLDFLFSKPSVLSDPGICSECSRYSDHYPIWATLTI